MQKREKHRLALLPRCLKNSDHHHICRDRGAGNANDPQEMLPVGDGIGMVYEEPNDRHCAHQQNDRSQSGQRKAVKESRLDGRAHTGMVLCGVGVGDERQHALRHAGGNGERERVDFFRNAHPRNGVVGIRYHHFVERQIGGSTHQGHHKRGEADQKDLFGDALPQGIILRRELDDRVRAVFIQQQDKIHRGSGIGKHRRQSRARHAHVERVHEDRVEQDVEYPAKRDAEARLLRVSFGSDKVRKTGVPHRGNAADRDRPKHIIRTIGICIGIRPERGQQKRAQQIERHAVEKRHTGGRPNTESGAFFRLLPIPRAKAARQ